MADLFVSYARADASTVHPIIQRLQAFGLSVWYDAAELRAGERWELAIEKALREATAVVTFVSDSPSDWVVRELVYALNNQIRLIPVLLPGADIQSLPPPLQRYQFIDLTFETGRLLTDHAAMAIEKAFAQLRGDAAHRSLRPDEVPGFARAAEIQVTDRPQTNTEQPTSIFIVHGHDEEMLLKICEFLQERSIEPIVLRDLESGATSLLDRFFEVGGQAKNAIVLLSGDDYGASVKQYEHPGVSDRALQFRARQNVILELGYFYGLLGWDRVYVLVRAPSLPYPNFERPSDLDGKVFNSFDAQGSWRKKLTNHLRQSGFSV